MIQPNMLAQCDLTWFRGSRFYFLCTHFDCWYV